MNVHKNAPLTPKGRERLVETINGLNRPGKSGAVQSHFQVQSASRFDCIKTALNSLFKRIIYPITGTHLSMIRSNSNQIKAIQVHHLGPRRHKVAHEGFLCVITGIDFRQRPQLGV